MKCVSCGARMKLRRETRRHDVGLDEPVVIEDVEIAHCPACGEDYVGIPRLEELHRLLAHDVASKSTRLTAKEIRFLRTHQGLSGVGLAREMGVTPETVCRWERADSPTPMGAVAERLLRLMVLSPATASSFRLRDLGTRKAAPFRMRVRQVKGVWAPKKASVG